MPSVGSLEYIWYTIAKKSSTGVLLQYWSTPSRHTPYDGVDGKVGPVVVFRGNYDNGTTYYGNSKRVDVVKHNGVYMIASVTAPSGDIGFSGKTPTLPSDYWNDFGAQFDSIATNLLLAEGASIGNWYIQGGKIVSTLDTGNKITLDASMAEILIESAVINTGGTSDDYGGSMNSGIGSVITANAYRGILEVRAKNRPSYSTGTSYMSPTGIFANLAGTEALPASSGRTHRGAIVGLGFANVDKSQWSMGADETIVAGVYGRASNSGTAPAFGGYFWNLKACGMVFNRRFVSDNSGTTYLTNTDVLVIGLTNSGVSRTIYLPTNAPEGQMLIIQQMGAGSLRVDTYGGQVLADDASTNDYFDIASGETAMFTFGIWNINGVTQQVWTFGKFKW
jgi:hypothetical protein